MTSCPSLDSLLADTAWLRGLTRRLMRDPESADDLQQEIAVAALASPAAARGGRAWLTAVAHNLAALVWRRARRERHRLSLLAPREPSPPTVDLVETAELQQRAVAAVLRLPPVYRDTVLLRFLQGRSIEQVAHQLGVPAETVRTRQRRALAILRAELAPERAPTRARGLAGLWVIGVAMQSKHVATAAAALVLLALGGALWLAAPADGPAAPLPAPVLLTVAAPATAVVPAPTVADEPSAIQRDPVAVPQPAAPPAPAAARPGKLVVAVEWVAPRGPVQGRVVLCRRHFGPAVFATTDAAGAVRFEDLEPGTYFVSTSNMMGRDVALPSGGEERVFLNLSRELTVRGRVVDADDQPVPFAEIFARQTYIWPAFVFPVGRADARGAFEVLGLSAVESVGARDPHHGVSACQTLNRSTDGVVETVLRLEGPGVATVWGRVVDAHGAPVRDAWVQVQQPGQIRPGADGSLRTPPPPEIVRTDRDGKFVAHWAMPGPNNLYVYRQGFAPHRRALQLVANERHQTDVELRPGATLIGSVRDADGEAAVGAIVRASALLHPQVGWQTIAADGTFRFEDLPPGEIEFVVVQRDVSQVRQKLVVTASESHTWHAVLGAERVLIARLVDQAQAPLKGWFVQRPHGDRWAGTDDDGRFRLPDCAPQDNIVQVRASQPLAPVVMRFEGVRPGPGEQTFVVPADRAPSAHVRGQCVGADGAPLSGVLMRLIQDGELVDDRVKSAADGSFALGALPPGRYTLRPTHPECAFEPVEVDLQPFGTKDLGVARGRRP